MPNRGGQEIVKKKAPVQATGGGGFRYENAVAARFFLDLLGGTNALGADFGRITRLDWQARDAGWLAALELDGVALEEILGLALIHAKVLG